MDGRLASARGAFKPDPPEKFSSRPRTLKGTSTLACHSWLPTGEAKNGGGGGIRTHGTFRLSSFQDWRNRPLYHPSSCERGGKCRFPGSLIKQN